MVDTYSREWLLECLARKVAKLDGVDARRTWLAEYEVIHGAAAAGELRRLVAIEFEKLKGSADADANAAGATDNRRRDRRA